MILNRMSEAMHSLCGAYLRLQTVFILIHLSSSQYPLFDFGCKTYGCNPRGDFGLPTPVTDRKPVVKWTWTEKVVIGDPHYVSKGCCASMASVVCPTAGGYYRLEPRTGKQLWKDNNFYGPNLPYTDFYGNVFGSDSRTYQEVYTGFRVQPYVNLAKFEPVSGLTMSDEQTVLFTSSSPTHAQVITLKTFTDQSTVASLKLSATVNNVTGTFVSCRNQVINHNRAYILTQFTSDSKISNDGLGELRLYAIDLPGYALNQSKIAWYFDFPLYSSCSETSVLFFGKRVYVNVASPPPSNLASSTQGYGAILYAITDNGNSPSMKYMAASVSGPMAVYGKPQGWWTARNNITITDPRTIWVANKSPATLLGHNPSDGNVLVQIALEDITKCAGNTITSSLMVTRLAQHPDRDVLVFGTQDDDGQAYVVALEAGLPPLKPRLLWSINVSGRRGAPGRVSHWVVGGQIASFTVMSKDQKRMYFGLAVSVVQRMTWLNTSQVHVKAIF